MLLNLPTTLIVSTFSWLSHLYERTRKRGWPVQNYHGVIITPWNYMFKTSWLTMHWSKKQCNSMWWWRMLHKDNDILSTLKTCWKICQTRPENFWTLSSSFWRVAMSRWLRSTNFHVSYHPSLSLWMWHYFQRVLTWLFSPYLYPSKINYEKGHTEIWFKKHKDIPRPWHHLIWSSLWH